MKTNSSPFKKCPRCHEKCLIHEKSCHECGLVFERLNYTSNKSGKKELLHGRRKNVIKTKEWPYDAKKSTALLLCGFLGITGAHNFYLGRFIKASIVFVGFLLTVILVILAELGFNDTMTVYNVIKYLAVLPGSTVLVFWISDFIAIFVERYPIPVAIDENLYKLKEVVLEPEKKVKEKKKNKK